MSVRQFHIKMTLDDVRQKSVFTMSALSADPDAEDLLDRTTTWMERIDAVEASQRALQYKEQQVNAQRRVAHTRLVAAARHFADLLLLDVNKNKEAMRWQVHMRKMSITQFSVQPLDDILAQVQAWILLDDPVMQKNASLKAELSLWAERTAKVADGENAVAVQRSLLWQARNTLTSTLTRERDALHAALLNRAHEKNLPRDWPQQFFSVDKTSSTAKKASKTDENADSTGETPQS